MFLIGCTALLDILVYWRTISALLLLLSTLICVSLSGNNNYYNYSTTSVSFGLTGQLFR